MTQRFAALCCACIALAFGVTIGGALVSADFWPDLTALPSAIGDWLGWMLPIAMVVAAIAIGLEVLISWPMAGGGSFYPPLRWKAWLRKRYKGERTRAEFDDAVDGVVGMIKVLLGIGLLIAFFSFASMFPQLEFITGKPLAAIAILIILVLLASFIRSVCEKEHRLSRIVPRAVFHGLIVGAVIAAFT